MPIDPMNWMSPGGRLTFVRTEPRPSNIEGATAIYYVPYLHPYVTVPGPGGTVLTMQIPATGVVNNYADATKNPAAVPAAVVHFGLFLWNDNGVLTLTRSPTVPAASGAIAPACTLALGVNNLLVNAAAIPNGPALGMGLFVGTAFTATDGKSYMRTAGVNNGTIFGLANYYNRLMATTQIPYAQNTGPANRLTISLINVAMANGGLNDYQLFTSTWGFSGAAAVGGYSGTFLRAGYNNNATTPALDWYNIGVPSNTTTMTNTVSGAPIVQPGCWTFYLGVTDAATFSPGGWGRSNTEFSLEI